MRLKLEPVSGDGKFIFRERKDVELVERAPADPKMVPGTKVTFNDKNVWVVATVEKAVGQALKLQLEGNKSCWKKCHEVELKR